MARPVQLAKWSKFIVLASVCVIVGALYFAREVLVPLALAILLTFLLTPLVRRLEKLRLGRVASTLIVVVLGLLLVAGIGWIVEQQFVQIANQLPDYTGQIRHKLQRLTSGGGGIGGAMKKIEQTVQEVAPRPTTAPSSTQPASQPAGDAATQPAVARSFGTAGGGAGAVGALIPPANQPSNAAPGGPVLPNVTPENPLPVRDYPEPASPVKQVFQYIGVALDPLATAGIVIVFVIFMLLKREDLRDRIIRLMGYGRLNLTTQAIDDAGARISRYLLSQAMINGTYGVLVAGGLFGVGHLLGHGQGFPSVLLWGLLSGLFRFVPYIGPWIGASGPLVVAFGFFPGNGVFFGVVAMYVVLELVASQVIEPLMYGSSTGMSTLAVLVAAVFWTWLWGPVGLLLSTPITAVLVVMGKYVPQLQFLDVLLGDEPVLEPPVRVYQRLLALDQEEAADLAREYLTERGALLSVYDEVLVPVLALAEEDANRGQLDDERLAFVHQAMRSIVDELGDLSRETAAKAEKASADEPEPGAAKVSGGDGTGAVAAPARATPAPTAPRPSATGNGQTGGNGKPGAADAVADRVGTTIPKDCRVNVVCLPARGEGDEIAGLMLAQLLEERGYCAVAVSETKLASEMVEAVEANAAHAVVVSALPPAAISHSRYLCKRLHARYGDDMNMVVGLWTAAGDMEKAKSRVTCVGTVRMATLFRQALEDLYQLAQPAIVNASTAPATTRV